MHCRVSYIVATLTNRQEAERATKQGELNGGNGGSAC